MDPRELKPIFGSPPKELRIYFFDDQEQVMVKTLQNLFPRLTFTVIATGATIKATLDADHLVSEAFKREEFKSPATHAPFDLFLMDEQHGGGTNGASSGFKFAEAICLGTSEAKDLKDFGALPGGYRGEIVMYSTNSVYAKSPQEIAEHLLKSGEGRGFITKGFPKSPMIETIGLVLNDCLKKHGISASILPFVEKKPKNPLSILQEPTSTKHRLSRHKKFNSVNNGLSKVGAPSPDVKSPSSAPASLFNSSIPLLKRNTSVPTTRLPPADPSLIATPTSATPIICPHESNLSDRTSPTSSGSTSPPASVQDDTIESPTPTAQLSGLGIESPRADSQPSPSSPTTSRYSSIYSKFAAPSSPKTSTYDDPLNLNPPNLTSEGNNKRKIP